MSINRPVLSIIAGSAVVIAAAVLAVPAWRHWHETEPPPPAPLRLTLPAVDDVTIGGGPDHPFGLALAPDSRRVVFPASRAGTTQLWLRDLTTGEAWPLTGTTGGVLPFWAPDGNHLAFFADGRLKSLRLADGEVSDLTEAPAPRGGVWHPDGRLIFAADDSGIVEWHPDRAERRRVTTVDPAKGESSHRFPFLIRRPGDDSGWELGYLVQASESSRAGLWTVSGVRLTASDSSGLSADDFLLYARAGALFAQRIAWSDDTNLPSLTGTPQLVGMPVGHSASGHLLATATSDTVIFGTPQRDARDLRWIERRDGSQSTLATEVEAWDLRIAPRGGRVAVTQRDAQLGTLDVWMYEAGRLLPHRISQGIDIDELVVWSPDASRVAWIQARRAIAMRGAGAQLPEETIRTFDAPVRLWDWSPDGRTFVIGQTRPGTRDDLFIVHPDNADDPPVPYAQSSFNETHADISPDGRWIAYASDESGQPEIYVDSFPAPGRRARVTTGGGSEPRWGAGVHELFFRRGRELHVATLSLVNSRLEATGTTRLFDAGGDIRAYDVTPDGQRFLVNVRAPAASAPPTTIVVHWQSLLQ
jgi:WD40 repeat protein